MRIRSAEYSKREELKAIMIQVLALQKQQEQKQLQQQKRQHEQQLQLQQQKFFESFAKTMVGKTSDSFTPNTVTNSISEFVYNPNEGKAFPAYRRYKGIVHIGMMKRKFVYY